jgi:hypothetical protein
MRGQDLEQGNVRGEDPIGDGGDESDDLARGLSGEDYM